MTITAKVLAIRRLDFLTAKDEEIKGYQVWLSAESTDGGWQGVEVMKAWVSDENSHARDAAALISGDTVIVEFNRYGKPVITDYAPVVG